MRIRDNTRVYYPTIRNKIIILAGASVWRRCSNAEDCTAQRTKVARVKVNAAIVIIIISERHSAILPFLYYILTFIHFVDEKKFGEIHSHALLSQRLRRYTMWCTRTNVRFYGTLNGNSNDIRRNTQMGCATLTFCQIRRSIKMNVISRNVFRKRIPTYSGKKKTHLLENRYRIFTII